MGKAALGCGVVLLLFLLAVVPAALAEAVTRADFPPRFVFGVGSSAYQVRYNLIDRGLGQIHQFLPWRRGCVWTL
jgi:beta-glucosidase